MSPEKFQPPLCIDLYCGLGGWAQGFLAEGYTWYDWICHTKPAQLLKDSGKRLINLEIAGYGQPRSIRQDMDFSSQGKASLQRGRIGSPTASHLAKSRKAYQSFIAAIIGHACVRLICLLEHRPTTCGTVAPRADGPIGRATKAANTILTPLSATPLLLQCWSISPTGRGR